ncbi:MAG TPA: GNAT family protein [Candidatus Acidoferrum sp.]|nr:GNAT family protein [Candidatus Acidoferrum sp.]
MIKIRRLRKSDWKGFLSNELSYYEELRKNPRFGTGSYNQKVTNDSLRERFLEMTKEIAKGKEIVLIAEDDGQMIGMCSAKGPSIFEGPHTADIGFSIIKSRRGEGVGSMLVKEMLKLCRKKYEIVTAGYFSNNLASKALLKKFGFKRWAHGPGFAKRGRVYMDIDQVYLRLHD